MKLFIASAAAALLGTVALADESTKYNDLRLDTSESAAVTYSDEVRGTDLDGAQRGRDQIITTADDDFNADMRLSTRNELRTNGEGYIYGGYGPGNDSR
jgi:hypothetical protein